MGIAGKFKVKLEGYKAASANSSHAWNTASLKAIARRSGVKLAGAFLLIAAIAGSAAGAKISAAGGSNPSADSNDKKVTVQVGQSAAVTPAAPAADSTPAPTNTDVSASTTTNSDNSGTSTQVTVNGQPVAVPANGSTQQTITSPGQQTTVQVSNNQANSGTADSHISTNTSIRTSSTNTNTTEDDSTP